MCSGVQPMRPRYPAGPPGAHRRATDGERRAPSGEWSLRGADWLLASQSAPRNAVQHQPAAPHLRPGGPAQRGTDWLPRSQSIPRCGFGITREGPPVPGPPTRPTGPRAADAAGAGPRPNLGGMEYRTLGRTGVKVSPLCLGAMMFGAWGNPDHDESIRIIHAALDAGINFIDTADVYSAGESEEIVGKALARAAATTSCWPPRSTAPMGEDPNRAGQLPALDHAGVREQPAPARHRLDRPLPDPPARPVTDIDETLGALTDLVHAGQGPLPRQLDLPRPRRSSRPSGRPSGAAGSGSCASSRRTRSWCGASRPTCCPRAQRYGMGVIPWSPLAGGWLSGKYRKGRDIHQPPGHAGSRTATTCRCRATRRKLEAADALAALADEAGMSLIHLALAFVINHPAVTAAIIGPRTMEQLEGQLGAADVRRSTTTCSTASTRSCRPGPTSTRPTPAGSRPPWPRRGAPAGRSAGAAARPGGDQVRAVAADWSGRGPRRAPPPVAGRMPAPTARPGANPPPGPAGRPARAAAGDRLLDLAEP